MTETPVRMKPRSSRTTEPSSQDVRGSPPMKTNRWLAGWVVRSPVRASCRVTCSRWSLPWASATTVQVCTWTFSIAASCSMRYCDIDASSAGPRTRMWTELA